MRWLQYLSQELQLYSACAIYPMNSHQAIFHVDQYLSSADFEFNFSFQEVTYSVFRWDKNFWETPPSSATDFTLEIFGVPYQFWS